MIYLIESAGYNKDSDIIYECLLNIGYVDDDKKEREYSIFRDINPTIRVLYEISGTKEFRDEILGRFSDLYYGVDGWFRYSEDIINFFKDIKSLEDFYNI